MERYAGDLESLTALPKLSWRDPRGGRCADTESAHPLAGEGGEFSDILTETNHGGFDRDGAVVGELAARRSEGEVACRSDSYPGSLGLV